MNPTKAQIEAARLSEENLHSIGHARYLVERATPDNPEVCFDYELVADLLSIIDRLTAAAEVGYWLDNPTAEQVEERWERCFKDAADNIRRKERAATIERCAQVAESYDGYISAPSPKTLAAAIRALKDKPPTDPNIIYPGKDLTNVFPEEDA